MDPTVVFMANITKASVQLLMKWRLQKPCMACFLHRLPASAAQLPFRRLVHLHYSIFNPQHVFSGVLVVLPLPVCN